MPPITIIAHLNVCSLKLKTHNVNSILRDYNCDVLCLSETWLKPKHTDISFPGYKMFRRDRPGGKGGGVCIIFRDTMQCDILTVPTVDSKLESLWVSISTVIVGVIYRPPCARVISIDALHGQLVHVLSKKRPVYVLGDINLDTLKLNKTGVGRYIEMLDKLNIKQLVKTPTRPESGTLIDHVLVAPSDDVTIARVEPCSFSDHDLVIAETFVERVQ